MNRKYAALHPEKKLQHSHCRVFQFRKLPICMALSCIFSSNVQALPQNPTVAFGGIGITSSNKTLNINQAGNKAVINWQQFSIAPGESVRFNQPSSTSITLNRVTGADSSTINGTLTANGRIFIINPNGVLFGENAQLNVGGIVASTMGISDPDFLSSNYIFRKEGNTSRSVINSGSITAVEGGYVVMLSDQVKNYGTIDSPAGSVLMGAGAEAALYFSKNALVGYAISKETAAALVENAKKIRAQGGTVSLIARGINSLDQAPIAVVNNTGIIEAQALKNKAGKIELSADMHSGRVSVSGTLDASGMEYKGGEISTSAATVNIDPNAVISTNGQTGKTGTWTVNAGNATIGEGWGSINQKALDQALQKNNVVINALGTGVDGTGNLVVSKPISSSAANKLFLKAVGDISINESVSVDKGGIVVYADILGTGTGSVKFSGFGTIGAKNNGAIDLYTNVARYTDDAIYNGFITTPYNLWMLVNNADQLQKINTNLSGKYALGRDIDASETRNWNSGAGFSPLGMSIGNPFVGKLDGMNHTISNLYINRPATDFVGLFGLSKGEISNLGLINAYVRASDHIGTFIGSNQGGILSNVYATGYVRAEGDPHIMSSGRQLYAGGLVGSNEMKLENFTNLVAGRISDAYSDVTVSGNSGLGGIVGANLGILERVFATGRIELTGDIGSSLSGGITGNNDYRGIIRNAYWSTDRTGQSAIAGQNFGQIDNASRDRKLIYSDFKTIAMELEFSEKWFRYDGYSIPMLKSFLKPLTIYSLDQDISKVYDGQSASSTEKYYFSDKNVDPGNLQATPFTPFESDVDAGSYARSAVRNFWSNQQGYLIENPVLENSVNFEIDHRPIVVKAVTDSRLDDGSRNSSLLPEVSGSILPENHGLVSGDTMVARQAFDSSEAGNRMLQVSDVKILNKDGKDVTSNYRIAKLDTAGVIQKKPAPEVPQENPGNTGNTGGGGNEGNQGGSGGNSGNQGGNNNNGGNQGVDGASSGSQSGNSGNPFGPIPVKPDQSNGNAGQSAGNGAINGNSGIPGNTKTADNPNENIALNTNPVDRFSRTTNSLVWQNVDDEEAQKLRRVRRLDKNSALVTVKDGGMNTPAE